MTGTRQMELEQIQLQQAGLGSSLLLSCVRLRASDRQTEQQQQQLTELQLLKSGFTRQHLKKT